MATELHDKLTFINEEKNKKILPENIKKGIKIFNVEGVADVLDTSDANATASDLLQGKSAYVQGTKIEGTIPSIEVFEVTPQMDQESVSDCNAFVGSVRVPSILDIAGGESEPVLHASNLVGGPRGTTVTTTVNTVPGGMLVACVHYRSSKMLSGEGWTSVAINEMITAENYYQWAEVLVKPTTGTSESITLTTWDSNGRIALGLISYDMMCPLELVSEYSSGPKRVSQSPIQPAVKKGDIIVVHNFWTSSGCYIGGVSVNPYRRCSDGGRFAMGVATADSNSLYYYNDSTSEIGGMVLRINSALTSEDIKVGRKILGITGTYTSDATAQASDIMTGKTAYVNGIKVSGNIATLGEEVQVTATNTTVGEENDKLIISSVAPSSGILPQGATYQITANGQQVMGALSLAPDMLRSGVNVLGVEGTYGADASEFAAKYETSGRTSGLTPLTMITSIQFVNMEGVTDASKTFESLSYLKSLPEMNLDSATSMTNFCQYDTNLVYMPNLSIPKVTTIAYAFRNCFNISKINLTNTNSLTTFTCAFENCRHLTSMPNLNYNGAYAMTGCFNNSGIEGHIDMSGFTKSGTAMTFTSTFDNCQNITSMSGFNKQGTAQLNMQYMFRNCLNLRTVDNCNFFNANWTAYMFSNCINLTSITNTGFSYPAACVSSEVQDKAYMFYNCSNLTTLDNNFWINFQARGMNYMFTNCVNLQFPDKIFINMPGNNWYYGCLTNTFQNCHGLKEVEVYFPTQYYASSYNYSPYFNRTFENCSNLHTITINNLKYNNVGSMFSGQPFTGCPNLTNIQFVNFVYLNTSYKKPYLAGVAAGSGITSINNITGINLFDSFSGWVMFANCHKLHDLGEEYLNFRNMTSAAYMFANCYNLTQINYNQINVNVMQNAMGMFAGCNGMSLFNDWNFIATTMTNYMFDNTTFDMIENLNFPLLQYGQGMFQNSHIQTVNNIYLNSVNGHSMFQNANIETVSNLYFNAPTQVNYMFNGANIRELKDINLSKVTMATHMFANSNIGNISNINLINVNNAYGMFMGTYGTNVLSAINMPNVKYAQYLCSGIKVTTLKDINLTIGNASATYMFSTSNLLQTVENVNLYINSQSTQYMFMQSPNLTTVRNLTLSNLGNMYFAFNSCSNLTTVENINMPFVSGAMYMFANCYNLRTVTNISMPSVKAPSYLFLNCNNLTIAPSIDSSNFTTMEYMFQGCNNITDMPAMECANITYTYTMFGPLPNLQNFGGWINLGKAYETAYTNNGYMNLYLNWYPNLTQQSLWNIVDNLYPTKNWQRIFLLSNQYQMLDSNYRSKLQNEKHRYIYTVSK